MLAILPALLIVAGGGPVPRAAAEPGQSFTAVGRLNVAGYRHRRQCSATLVAPDVALTARHCVRAFSGAHETAPGNVHLLLGYARGQWREHHRVAAYSFPARVRDDADVVLLHLTARSALPPLSIAPRDPVPGATVVQAGYGRDRAHALSVDEGCRLLGRVPDGRWRHDCETTFGESGGPLLAPFDGTWRVIAVVSGHAGGIKLAEPVAGIEIGAP